MADGEVEEEYKLKESQIKDFRMAFNSYDKLFHLSLDIKLSNGKLIKLEKNERVSISEIRNFGSSKDDLNIDLPNITLNEFIVAHEK